MAAKTNKKLEVSIIIVNYKSYEMTDNCISSIYKYTQDVNYEIILVDNATDYQSLLRLINKYPCIKTIRNKENLGFSVANNQAINIIEGENILFLNNDTLFYENSLKTILGFNKEIDSDVFVGCKLLNKNLTSQVSVFAFDRLTNLLGENLFLYKIFKKNKYLNKYFQNHLEIKTPTEVDVIRGAFMFCPTKKIRELSGFDERFFFYSEEADLCFRFKKMKGKVIYFPNTSIIHIGSATSDQNKFFRFKNLSIGKIQFYQKHYIGIKFILSIIIHYTGITIRIPTYFIIGLFSFSKNNLLKSFYYFKTLFIYPKNMFNLKTKKND